MEADDERIIFALDFSSFHAARRAAVVVRDAVGMLKIGLELFVEAGPDALAIGQEVARPIFLDLKLHDIPETVDRAVARVSGLGAHMVTVHASGGPAMLRRAVERAKNEGRGTQIAAVTVLTSLDGEDLRKLGVTGDVIAHACRLARVAFDEGVRAFVCSPQEVSAMRKELGRDVTLITPGVRPSGPSGISSAPDAPESPASRRDDQKRVTTAEHAIREGADWVVVGRPIRDATDPLAAARAISAEIHEARKRRSL
jgi:orotidine-5'-phosphate decarboxylase